MPNPQPGSWVQDHSIESKSKIFYETQFLTNLILNNKIRKNNFIKKR